MDKHFDMISIKKLEMKKTWFFVVEAYLTVGTLYLYIHEGALINQQKKQLD